VTIDIETYGSPGWWLWRLTEEHRRRQPRLHALWERYSGNPPMPKGAENAKEAYQAFQKLARSNYAELATHAVVERMNLLGFRTSEDQTLAGITDPDAEEIWLANEMPLQVSDVHTYMAVMGEGYTITGPPDPEFDGDGAAPIITAEDPREVITAHDPARPARVLAGIKVTHDDATNRDRVYVYLPGQGRTGRATVWIAQRRAGGSAIVAGRGMRFSPQGWEWVGEPTELPTRECPVTRYQARDGVGVFERHTDLLDRINHMILQRMVIATMQAFRQRVVKGVPLQYPAGHPKAGQDIDYDEILTADPGAVWLLPATADLWESGQVDLTPILSSVKDDVRDFAALTRTPMSYFVPDAANGSAEGASTMREGLVFRVEDFDTRAGVGHARTMSLGLAYAGKPAARVSPLWAPAERFSLAQRYDAAVKAVTAGVPWRTRMISVLQYTPAEVERMESERMTDELLAPTAAAPVTPAAPAQPTTPAPADAGTGTPATNGAPANGTR
jgi:hypothetical protein